MRYMWVVMVAVLFGGCAKYVETNVAVFHEMGPHVSGVTYAIVPGSDQDMSLEYQSYARLLKVELDKRGMVEVPQSRAAYLITMSYGVDSGKQVFSSMPVYGHTGIWGSFSTGNLATRGNTATYTGVTINTPMYGIVGSETRSEVLFSRFLTIDIVEAANNTKHKIYEAKALSIGETAMLISVVPAMIQSVFEDFPGVSGTTRFSKQPLLEKK